MLYPELVETVRTPTAHIFKYVKIIFSRLC